jgi:hypothetical protein
MSHLHKLFKRPMKTGQAECSETSTHEFQRPENHPKERIQHSQHDDSLKLSIMLFLTFIVLCQPLLYFSYKQVLQFVLGFPFFFLLFLLSDHLHTSSLLGISSLTSFQNVRAYLIF